MITTNISKGFLEKDNKLHDYLKGNKWTTRPINHIKTDQTTQPTMKRTRKPAKIVRKGGPCSAFVSFDVSFSEPSLEMSVFDA